MEMELTWVVIMCVYMSVNVENGQSDGCLAELNKAFDHQLWQSETSQLHLPFQCFLSH